MRANVLGMADHTPRRIDWSGATLPKPSQDLFDAMGKAIMEVVECWADDLGKKGVYLADIEDVWASAAAAAYAEIVKAGGGSVTRIEKDRH